ncbi:MAG: hypothetical protein J5586_07240 [Clostridia bacterium]|nr:hypothetical protein [Clostridia bacterium]
MDRQRIIEELAAFPYDRGEYWVLMGGAMALYGIRGETADIDLGCTAELADRLEADGLLYRLRDNGKRWFRFGSCIEIFEGWLCGGTVTLDGLRVVTPEGLVEMKMELGREKDLRDIELIERYMRDGGGLRQTSLQGGPRA